MRLVMVTELQNGSIRVGEGLQQGVEVSKEVRNGLNIVNTDLDMFMDTRSPMIKRISGAYR